jgi:hypothetical protein
MVMYDIQLNIEFPKCYDVLRILKYNLYIEFGKNTHVLLKFSKGIID